MYKEGCRDRETEQSGTTESSSGAFYLTAWVQCMRMIWSLAQSEDSRRNKTVKWKSGMEFIGLKIHHNSWDSESSSCTRTDVEHKCKWPFTNL